MIKKINDKLKKFLPVKEEVLNRVCVKEEVL